MRTAVGILIFVAVCLLGLGLLYLWSKHEQATRKARLDELLAQAERDSAAQAQSVRIVKPAERVDGEPVRPEPIRPRREVINEAVRRADADRRERNLRERSTDPRRLTDTDIVTTSWGTQIARPDYADAGHDPAGSQDYGSSDPVGSNDAASSYDSGSFGNDGGF